MVDVKSVPFGGRPTGIIDTPYTSRHSNICRHHRPTHTADTSEPIRRPATAGGSQTAHELRRHDITNVARRRFVDRGATSSLRGSNHHRVAAHPKCRIRTTGALLRRPDGPVRSWNDADAAWLEHPRPIDIVVYSFAPGVPIRKFSRVLVEVNDMQRYVIRVTRCPGNGYAGRRRRQRRRWRQLGALWERGLNSPWAFDSDRRSIDEDCGVPRCEVAYKIEIMKPKLTI